jgi:hypothetical protein
VFRLMRALAARDYEGALPLFDARRAPGLALAEAAPTEDGQPAPWTPAELEAAWAPFYEDHQAVSTDRKARHPQLLKVTPAPGGRVWQLEQVITDPDAHDDWLMRLEIDLERSRQESRVVASLAGVGPI